MAGNDECEFTCHVMLLSHETGTIQECGSTVPVFLRRACAVRVVFDGRYNRGGGGVSVGLGKYGLHWCGRSRRRIVDFFISRSTEDTSLLHGELIGENDIPFDMEVSRTSDL